MHCVLRVGISRSCVIEFDGSPPPRLIVNQLGYKHCYQDWKLSENVMAKLAKRGSEWHPRLQGGQGVYRGLSGIRVQPNLITIFINYFRIGLQVSEWFIEGAYLAGAKNKEVQNPTKESDKLRYNSKPISKSHSSGDVAFEVWPLKSLFVLLSLN